MALPGKYKKKINLTRDRQNTEYTENMTKSQEEYINMEYVLDMKAKLHTN